MLPSYFPRVQTACKIRPRGNSFTNSGAWFQAKTMSCVICF